MLLRSEIADTLLAEGVELVVVSPNADEEYFQEEFNHPQISLEKMPSRFSRVEARLVNLRQYFLMNPSLGATLNHKNESFRRHSPGMYWFARTVNSVLGRVGPLRRAYLRMENRLFPGAEFDSLLDRHKPDLVTTGTPGYNRDDIHCLRAARRGGISTATVMLSWDNLTSKGYMGVTPDHLLVWSDLMADEAVEYHDFPRSKIRWTGAAQFDCYFGVRDRLDRRSWRRQHGLAEDVPLLVYGTINPAILPHEIEIVRQIVAAARSGKFRRRPHIWIRLHPQVMKGAYSQSIEPYRALAGEGVTVEEPQVQSTSLAWDLPKQDAAHLAELLAAADVVSTPSSTLVIDAAAAGAPIVNVLFDGCQVEAALSVRRFEKYTHYAKILATGGIARAYDIDEYVRQVDEYVDDPQRDDEGRQRLIEQQLGCLDGAAGRRTAQALMDLAARGELSATSMDRSRNHG